MPKKIYLAVGHGTTPSGAHDPGSIGYDGTREHDVANRVARRTLMVLKNSGLQIREAYEEVDEKDPNFIGTVSKVNNLSPDMVVAIHFDYRLAPRGGFGIWPNSRHNTAPSKKLTLDIARQYRKKNLPQRESYADIRGLYLLRAIRHSIPVVIWECDRVSDYPQSHIRAMGEAIALGILDYFSIRPGKGTDMAEYGRGDSGRWVRRYQRFLLDLGHNMGNTGPDNNGVDGDFGPRTEAAVKQFQRDNWLPRSGVLDSDTIPALHAVHQAWRQHGSEGVKPKQNRDS